MPAEHAAAETLQHLLAPLGIAAGEAVSCGDLGPDPQRRIAELAGQASRALVLHGAAVSAPCWPTRGHLVQALREAGFQVVLEELGSDTGAPRVAAIRTPGEPCPPPAVSDPQARRLGLLLGRLAPRGRTLLIGAERLPGLAGAEVVRAASADEAHGVFADVLAWSAVTETADLGRRLEGLAARLAAGGALGLLLPDRRAEGAPPASFTPESFLDRAEALAREGRLSFRIDGFLATEPGAGEFVVRLRRTDPAEREAILETFAAARPLLDAEGSWRPAPLPAKPDLAAFRSEADAARAEPLAEPGGSTHGLKRFLSGLFGGRRHG
jgi:hypothetical protein